MSREIKFRALCTDGRMYEDWFRVKVHHSDTRGIDVYTGSMGMATAVSVMQYTGLLDDHSDTPIYEDDVVEFRIAGDGSNEVHRGRVIGHPLGTAFGLTDARFATDVRVLGNVHQHPNLLP